MTGGTKSGAQRARSLRPRCIRVINPETATPIYLSIYLSILLTQKALFFSKGYLRRTLWMESTMSKQINCFLNCTFQQETWVPNKTVVFIPRKCMAMHNAKLTLWALADINRTRVGCLPFSPDLTTCDLCIFLMSYEGWMWLTQSANPSQCYNPAQVYVLKVGEVL
jgi:hypothetical protein